MSPVFLSNVDDYLAPSQACVNPLFAEGVNSSKTNEKEDSMDAPLVGVIPRKRKTVRRRPGLSPAIPKTPQTEETAKVSMADCLACSGCVTSAETVLVEQHSLKTLKEKLSQEKNKKVVVTISPASWADLQRHLGLHNANGKVAMFLHQECRASIVLDGAVPLQWSLQEAAREFCHAHDQTKKSDRMDLSPPLPSIALSSTQSQRLDGTIVTHSQRSESQLPLLAASCPALVCLVEKSHETLVPHLATTKSPMSMAGSYFPSSLLHIGIMPCHDKKLEASRRDFASSDGIPEVDLVLTTSELVEWIAQTSASSNVDEMKQYIKSLKPAVSVPSLKCIKGDELVVLVEPEAATIAPHENADDNVFFEHSSGGFADYIFRYAAKELYGFNVPDGPLPWEPVTTSKRVSARAATSSRNFYAVSLHQSTVDGTCGLEQQDSTIPVLRFATAYGVQTLQRVFTSIEQYDYVEAMACPSGCLNGGGQNRLVERETPAQTRERVADTKRRAIVHAMTNTDVYVTECQSGPFGVEAQRKLHTRYHVVPPLQHTMGAAAGVSVQDTQW